MNLVDFIKQPVADHLPRNHQIAGLAILFALCLLTFIPDSNDIDTAEPIPLIPEKISKADIPAQAAPVASVLIPDSDPRILEEVRTGDNLSLIFDRVGLNPQDVYRISNSDESSDLARLYPGYKLAFDIDDAGRLEQLELIMTPLQSVLFTLNERNVYDVEHIERSPQVVPVYKEAVIDDSLFLAARRGGIAAATAMEIAGIFNGVIDFMLDTRAGDSFNVLYDENYLDGELLGYGAIRVARYTNQGETWTAIRYENADGEVAYYNPEGESMRKVFLRNPVDFTRISSNFSLSRRHPILNTIRAHKGTDYAAPSGTPVVATGDGRVSWAGRNGSFGNLVVIRHGGQYETKYAHLSAYANGIRAGTRVKQGQLIGYVGSTGSATGPHLHYEFLLDGVHRNPRTIHERLPKAESIPAGEMERFRQQSRIILAELDAITSNPALAQNSAVSDRTE